LVDEEAQKDTRATVQRLIDQGISDPDALIEEVKKATAAVQKDGIYAGTKQNFKELLADLGGKRPAGERDGIRLRIGSTEERLDLIEAQLKGSGVTLPKEQSTQQRIETLAAQFGIDIREYGLQRTRDNPEMKQQFSDRITAALNARALESRDVADDPLNAMPRKTLVTITASGEQKEQWRILLDRMGIKPDSVEQNAIVVDLAQMKPLLNDEQVARLQAQQNGIKLAFAPANYQFKSQSHVSVAPPPSERTKDR
jgi:hypothetical protein